MTPTDPPRQTSMPRVEGDPAWQPPVPETPMCFEILENARVVILAVWEEGRDPLGRTAVDPVLEAHGWSRSFEGMDLPQGTACRCETQSSARPMAAYFEELRALLEPLTGPLVHLVLAHCLEGDLAALKRDGPSGLPTLLRPDKLRLLESQADVPHQASA
jgi:hypothetical protein